MLWLAIFPRTNSGYAINVPLDVSAADDVRRAVNFARLLSGSADVQRVDVHDGGPDERGAGGMLMRKTLASFWGRE